MMVNDATGERLSNEAFQARIREIVAKHGRYILNCPIQPRIGEVQMFAGLPMRVTRHATYQEALAQNEGDGEMSSDEFYFEVEVAD